jgi:F0F1-type ATP synthase membrane subunit b/b'
MFNYLEKQKRRQQRTQKARILFFSFMSSIVTATIAIFFSQKDNRQKVVQSARQISNKAKEVSSDLSAKVSSTSKDLSTKTVNLFDKYKAKLPSKNQVEEVTKDLSKEVKKDTRRAKAKVNQAKNKVVDKI